MRRAALPLFGKGVSSEQLSLPLAKPATTCRMEGRAHWAAKFLQEKNDVEELNHNQPFFLRTSKSPSQSFKMPQGLDKCKERPETIDNILSGLDRYNPETTTTFQEYVSQQCEEKFFDSYASLALLKL